MIEILSDPALLLLAIPTLIIALNNMLKSIGLDKKYCPLISMICGFIAFPFLCELGVSWYASIIGCFMIGLSSSGFYDIATKTFKKE